MEETRLVETERFEVPFKGRRLVADRTLPAQAPQAIFLHGAGQSIRSRNDFFRKALASDGIASVAFDQIGHGETEGELLGDSLESRTQQAQAVMASVGLTEPLLVGGSSMGAYTAVKLTSLYPVKNLALVIPAMYDAAAYALPFGPKFSGAIRRPESWRDSDAWEILGKFTGNLFMIRAGQDQVIPDGVIELLLTSATQAATKEVFVVPDSGHQIYTSLETDNFFGREFYPAIRQRLLR